MSESPWERLLRERVDEVLAELERDGWEILPADQLAGLSVPSRLVQLAPDIVAKKGSELLVGEFKSRNSRGLDVLNDLADAVAELPNARLEVYWLGDDPQTDPARERIREVARNAQTLLTAGQYSAAAVIAWAAVEGALERYAVDIQAPVAEETDRAPMPWQLLSRLYSLGYVGEKDYQQLAELRKQRNAAAHLRQFDPPEAGTIRYVLAVVERMVNGQYVPVDQMVEWYAGRYDYPKDPAEQARIEALLEEHFPGVPESDIAEAVTELFRAAALLGGTSGLGEAAYQPGNPRQITLARHRNE